MTLYHYVGPPEIRETALAADQRGIPILAATDLVAFVESNQDDCDSGDSLTATYTVSLDGVLFLAPRRCEHVACAHGGPVQAAGEVTIGPEGTATGVSNQSTGFCPEATSWPAVAYALDALGLERPPDFTAKLVFRRCDSCGEQNVVKDGWFVCAACGSDLPAQWNLAQLSFPGDAGDSLRRSADREKPRRAR